MSSQSKQSLAILNDVTRCIGCEECVVACQRENELPKEKPWRWVRRIEDLSTSRWTTIRPVRTDDGFEYVRRQCRHCLEPECVSVCIVGALKKTPEGPVVYDRDICIGCRYCMIACPWEIPRYSWEDQVPYVQKCDMCYQRVVQQGKKPACVEACPTGATVFGTREQMLAEARRRIAANPERYKPRIWGERQVGGTSVLYISNIDLNLTDLDQPICCEDPLPQRTTRILHKMPAVFVGMATVMGGVHWVVQRRQKIAAEQQAAADPGHDEDETPR